MILDKNLTFANKLSVAAAAGSALVGDVIDLGAVNRKIGSGAPLHLGLIVTTAFASGGAATVQFRLMSGAAAAIVPASDNNHYTSQVFPYAQLTLGKRIIVELPAGIPDYSRYLGLVVATATATTTAGSISAFLTDTPHDWYATADADN